jgi:hypothetical protein
MMTLLSVQQLQLLVLLVVCVGVGWALSPPPDDDKSSSASKKIISFALYSAEEMAATMDRWGTHYGAFLYVSTAQNDYGLPMAGDESDCPFDHDKDENDGAGGCLNRFLILHPPSDENNDPHLPHVLWSGEVHGNERVGPTAVMEATQLLLSAVECHSLPRRDMQDGGGDEIEWDRQMQSAAACRRDLLDIYGVDATDLAWLARLYHTRRLIVVPTANALGYYRNQREEGKVDPNRDFPYDNMEQSTNECMQTIAARTINELYQDHLVQLALTFHGGMEVIGYEWGAPSYTGQTSQDDTAQHDIASYYAEYAGGFADTPTYLFGPYVLLFVFVIMLVPCVCLVRVDGVDALVYSHVSTLSFFLG